MTQTTNQHINNEKKGWPYVILGIMIMMCLGTVYSWSVFRVAVENHFGIGSTLSGLPYLVSLAVYSLSMLLSGRYLDKHSPRVIILAGGLLVGLGWILSSFAKNVYFLSFTFGVITGAGVGIVYGVPIAVTSKRFPKKSGLMVGIVLAGFGLSPLLTAPIAGSLVTNFGLLKTFNIIGIFFMLMFALLSLPMKFPSQSADSDKEESKKTAGSMTTNMMVKTKSFRGLFFNFLIGTTIGLTLIGMTSNVGIDMINLPQNTTISLVSLFAVFNGIGRPVFGWLTNKLSIKKSMLISYSLILIASLIMLAAGSGSTGLFIIAFSLFWFNLGGWLSIAPASTLALYGKGHYSQNYGVVFTAYGIGAIIGVLSTGLLKDLIRDYYVIFYFVIALCLTGLFSSQRLVFENKDTV